MPHNHVFCRGINSDRFQLYEKRNNSLEDAVGMECYVIFLVRGLTKYLLRNKLQSVTLSVAEMLGVTMEYKVLSILKLDLVIRH